MERGELLLRCELLRFQDGCVKWLRMVLEIHRKAVGLVGKCGWITKRAPAKAAQDTSPSMQHSQPVDMLERQLDLNK